MKVKAKYFFWVVVIIAVVTTIVIFQLSSRQEKFSDNTAVNEEVVKIRNFSVSSDSTDLKTSAKGTVFVTGDEGIPKHVRIVASIVIDPNDWGGVAFSIPDKWYISNIISSYPVNETQSIPEEFVSTWTTAETEVEWRARIEVGKSSSYKPTGGGSGTIVIDIAPDKNAIHQSETFNIAIAVGSDERGSIKIVGPDFIEVPISIIDNE
jgi:hypothetical protein